MKKLKYFLLIMVATFISLTSVDAEVPSGEIYSEFATNRTVLLSLITTSSDVNLYAYTPRLNEFLNGSLSLVRYENNYNDTYSNWAIRVYQSSRSAGNYTMNWVTSWTDSSSAQKFCSASSKPFPKGGKTNSTVCNVVGNTAYLSINYKLNIADTGTSYVDFEMTTNGVSINWFLRLATAVYYPQIVESSYIDTETLTQQQQTIINQNQQQINQNNTIINQQQQTNDKLNDLNENISSDKVVGVEGAFESFEGFIAENSTITQLISMPITLYTSILNGLQSTCQPFVLGNLFGTNLIIPCVNIGNYLGVTLWSMIDIIISGFAVFSISKKLIKIFNNFSSMKEGDVIND